MAHVIEIHSASRHFGAIHAVDDVSFNVDTGELFGLIGHNGAGKSTLFKMMLGLIAPHGGEIRLCGESVTGPQFRQVRRRIGYLPENLVLYDNLSAIETLNFFARLKGINNPQQCAELLETVGLTQAASRRVREYSKGMRQRLGFAQALLGQPQLLLLDEPTNGLDPQGIHEFYAVLDQVRATGTTVILSSHILAEIEQRVDRLALMSSGKLAALGTLAELSSAIALPLQIELFPAPGASIENIYKALSDAGFTVSIDAQKNRHMANDLPFNKDARAPLGTRASSPASSNHSNHHNTTASPENILTLHIAREDKLRLLPTLATLGPMLSDVRFIEPSLEAIFLGHHHPVANNAHKP